MDDNTKPDTFMDSTIISAKDNKNKKGEVTSISYSTAIPKTILNKLGLQKGQKLYWDIEKNNIIITPELPETQSIEAGIDILNDMLFNGTRSYTQSTKKINETLNLRITKEAKVDELTNHYNTLPNPQNYEFKKVVCYLLDYPVTPENHEIIQAVYDEITKTD